VGYDFLDKVSYIKNYFVLDAYDRIVWSMSENFLYFTTSYYIKPKIPNITRSIFLTALYYYNYYSFENKIFDLKSSINSSIISFSNLLISKFDNKTTNGDVFFEAFSSIAFAYSFYNIKNDLKISAIGSNLGYFLGFIFSQKNDLSLSKAFAIGIFTSIITYTLSGTFQNYKNYVYSLTPIILYTNYFIIQNVLFML